MSPKFRNLVAVALGALTVYDDKQAKWPTLLERKNHFPQVIIITPSTYLNYSALNWIREIKGLQHLTASTHDFFDGVHIFKISFWRFFDRLNPMGNSCQCVFRQVTN